ncbi:MAG: thiamine diphosphokinase [Oscillospiraceae bacterium]|nr:thiamine diphosphokinase [Oscillospiraceae bacterium]
MRAVIIGGGDFGKRQAKSINADDFVICADGGYDSAVKYDIRADIVIGDMDSVKSEIAAEKIVYPAKKDFTDGELAVRYALERGYKDILLTGFTGERLDHTISDIFMLSIIAENGASGMLRDENNDIYYLEKSRPVKLKTGKNENLSIVPLCGLSGLYTKGLEYPVNNEDMEFFKSRTLCNVTVSSEAEVGISAGRALIILSKDRDFDQSA